MNQCDSGQQNAAPVDYPDADHPANRLPTGKPDSQLRNQQHSAQCRIPDTSLLDTLSPARSCHDLWRTTSPSSSILSAHTIVCSHLSAHTTAAARCKLSFRSGHYHTRNSVNRRQSLKHKTSTKPDVTWTASDCIPSIASTDAIPPVCLLSSCPPSEPSPAPTETIGNSWRIVNTFLTFAQINVASVPTAEMNLILGGGSAFQTLPSSDLES